MIKGVVVPGGSCRKIVCETAVIWATAVEVVTLRTSPAAERDLQGKRAERRPKGP